MEYRLKATKASFYEMLKEIKPEAPNIRIMEFSKTPRGNSYFLRWYGIATHYNWQAYLTVCAGAAFVEVTAKDLDGEVMTRTKTPLSFDYLKKCGLVSKYQRSGGEAEK